MDAPRQTGKSFWVTLERAAELGSADGDVVTRPYPVTFGRLDAVPEEAEVAPEAPRPREAFADVHRVLQGFDDDEGVREGAEEFLDALERKNRAFEITGELDIDLDKAGAHYERDEEGVWQRGQDDVVAKRRLFRKK